MPLNLPETCRRWESAIRSGRVDEVDRLIQQGLDVNCGDCWLFDSPLKLAVFEGNGVIVQRLIGYGADVNPKPDERARPWHDTPLHLAAELGRVDLIELLVHAGAILDARDSDFDTPLWRAVRKGHRQVAIRLVKLGADVEVRGGNSTALGHDEVFKTVAPWLFQTAQDT